MEVERIAVDPQGDRAAWLSLRTKDVTASAAGALLGVHEYVTPLALYLEKTGAPAPQPENGAMKRGRLLEPVALQLIREQHPQLNAEPANVYVRDPAIRLGATPDAFARDARGLGVIQIKTVAEQAFRAKWRDAETGAIAPPLWIAVQAIVEAHLCGADWAAVAALKVSGDLDLHLIEVPLHAGVIERVREATVRFWADVAAGRAPDPDFSRDARLIAGMFAPVEGS
jgi:hypothetical protein